METFKSLYNPLNCFFVDVGKIEKALKHTFEFLLENFENSNDLKNYLILDNNEKINKKGLIIGYSIKPYVLCDNMRQIDIESRGYSVTGRVPLAHLINIVDRIQSLFDYY